jgi:uncharacterized membrane protein required for colicin V production
MLYHLIVLLAAAGGAVWGFRRGLARQTPSVIGMAFGIICTRILAPGLYGVLYGAFPSVHGEVCERFVYDTLSTTLVFCSVYMIFATVTGFLGKVLHRDDRTILDNLGGSLYGLFRCLLLVSIAYNFLLALNPGSILLKSARSDDGNAVGEVMLLAPSLLGGEDVEELFHRVQLEEAKKIS